MEKYKVSARVLDITESTTIMPENYGAWMAINQGTGTAYVLGYELQPGEGISFFDAVPAGSIWDAPIKIICSAGAVVRLTRLQYKPI